MTYPYIKFSIWIAIRFSLVDSYVNLISGVIVYLVSFWGLVICMRCLDVRFASHKTLGLRAKVPFRTCEFSGYY